MPKSGMTFFSPASNDGVFSQMLTSPFYPSFRRDDEGTLKLSFNNAYVFDYNNASKLLDPISIEAEEFDLAETDQKFFLVELLINKMTGEIKSGTIVERSEQPQPQGEDNIFKKLPITTTTNANFNHPSNPLDGEVLDVHNSKFKLTANSINNPTSDIYFKWLIRLADFEGEVIKQLYLRDNLHLNFTKIRQCGSDPNEVTDGSSSDEIPIIHNDVGLLPIDSHKALAEANGVLSFNSISPAKVQFIEKDQDNIIRMEWDKVNGVIKINADTTDITNRLDALENPD
jgi:hypothetical protein